MTQVVQTSLVAWALFASALWPHATRSQEAGNPETVRQGREVAETVCSNCHVVAPDQRFVPILRPPAPPFETLAQRSTMTADWLQTFLTTTHRDISNPRGMPNPQLIDSHIAQVSAYVLSLRKQPDQQAGQCSSEIARLQKGLDEARAKRTVVGSRPQSTSARLHRQPAPSAVETAETRAQQTIEASLAQARKLASEGEELDCMAVIGTIPLAWSPGAPSTSGFAASKRTAAAAASDARQLLRLMDNDRNGAVSRDEFMQFMSQSFDRFDVDRSGGIDSKEASNVAFPFGLRTSKAAKADIGQLLRLMDSDKNGTVTKDEFLQFMSQTFDRLDVNTNDRLVREELQRLRDPNWMLCHDLHIC
jgi:Ca2+-binding EF-hand superfamily protein/mono/diheme cytochrome c family protein